MAVRIRMKKMGRKHRPFFRIVAIDARQPREGRAIEELGSYDPMVKDKEKRVKLRAGRIKYWMSVGAKPSENVEVLLKKYLPIFERMEAEEGGRISKGSTIPMLPLAAPTNLQASAGDAQVNLNWTSSAGAANYNVYRGTLSQTVAAMPIQTDGTDTSFTDTGLTNGTPYVYTVTATNSSGQSPHSNLVSATPQTARWGQKDAEAQIEIWLRERGFGNRRSHPDYTCWSGETVFWQSSLGDLWCLALFPGGDLRFGVYAELLREAMSAALGGGGTLQEFANLGRNNPDFPRAIQLIQRTFTRDGREYWGVQIGPACGPSEVRALIAELAPNGKTWVSCKQSAATLFPEPLPAWATAWPRPANASHPIVYRLWPFSRSVLVNAFDSRMQSPGTPPWVSTGTRPGPQPGVLNERTVAMPDPAMSPHHGFIVTLADYIDRQLRRYGYRQRTNVGSYSWEGPSGIAGNVVGWKLCFHGRHDWRFGVRAELVKAKVCLTRQIYDFRFHVPPDTNAVFHGFRLYDTLASRARIKAVLDCLED